MMQTLVSPMLFIAHIHTFQLESCLWVYFTSLPN